MRLALTLGTMAVWLWLGWVIAGLQSQVKKLGERVWKLEHPMADQIIFDTTRNEMMINDGERWVSLEEMAKKRGWRARR